MAALNLKSNLASPSFTGTLTTKALAVSYTYVGVMPTTFINDNPTGQVDLYLQSTISTGLYETSIILTGGGNGLRITQTAHPILLQTASHTVLTLGVDKSATFVGLVTVGLSVRKSNSGYVTSSMCNDMVGQQVQIYMPTQPAAGVFDGAQIIPGGCE